MIQILTNDYLRKPLVDDEYGEAYPSLEVNGKKYLRIDTLNDDTHHSITHVYKLDKSNDSALDENKPKNENKDKDENKPKDENKDKIKPDIDDKKEGINNTDKSKSLDTANSSEVIKTETEDSSLVDSSKVKSPKTGDSKTLLTFITVLVISCIALVLLLVRKKLQK